jgi:hypothetical protein
VPVGTTPSATVGARLRTWVRNLTNREPPTFRETVWVSVFFVLAAAALLGAHIVNGNLSSDDWKLGAIFQYSGGTSHPVQVFHGFYEKTRERPMLALYVPATFAFFATNPHLHLAWLALMAAWVSIALYTALRVLGLSKLEGLIVSLIVLAFPYSDSLKLWIAASQLQFAIALYLTGTAIALLAFQRTGKRALALHAVSVVLYAASIMSYEATFGLVFFSVGLYVVKTRSRAVLIRSVVDMAVVVIVLLTVTRQTVKQVNGFGAQLHHTKIIFFQALDLFNNVLLPWGRNPSRWGLVLLVLIVFGAGVFSLVRGSPDPAARRRLRLGLVLIAGGVLSTAAAYIPYVPAVDYYSPYGTEELNRVNGSATMGYVILAFGLVLTVGAILFRVSAYSLAFTVAASAIIFAGCANQLIADVQLWDRAAANETQVMTVISNVLPNPKPTTTIYLWGSRTTLTSQLPVFSSTWDLTGAVQLWQDDFTINAFPILPATGFQCDKAFMYPTNGLYSKSTGADYTHGVFVDYAAKRLVPVRNQQECRRAVALLSTPTLTIIPVQRRVTQEGQLNVKVRVTRGDDPLIAAPVDLRLGTGSDAQSCTAYTLPSGVGECVFGVPSTMRGLVPITGTFAGNDVLRPASSPKEWILVDPPS